MDDRNIRDLGTLREQAERAAGTGVPHTVPAGLSAEAEYQARRTSETIERVFATGSTVAARADFVARQSGLMFSSNMMYTFGNALGASVSYRDQFMQSRALMGSTVDDSRISRSMSSLTSIGNTRSELLQVMQELAVVTGQVAENLDQSAKNVLTFSRATGLNAQVFTQAFGAAARGSSVGSSPEGQLRQFQNAALLVGGRREDMVLMPQMLSGLEAVREMTRQSGTTPGVGSGGIENGHHLMARMQALNPTLYRDRPDLAVQHANQITNVGRGPMLAIALEIARKHGGTGASGRGPIEFDRVLADLDAQTPYMARGMMKTLSENPGYRQYLAVTGQISAGLSVRLGENPGAADALFSGNLGKLDPSLRTMDGLYDAAREATSNRNRANARFMDSVQDTGSMLSRVQNSALGGVAEIGGGVLAASAVAGVGKFLFGKYLRRFPKLARASRGGGGGGGRTGSRGRGVGVGVGAGAGGRSSGSSVPDTLLNGYLAGSAIKAIWGFAKNKKLSWSMFRNIPKIGQKLRGLQMLARTGRALTTLLRFARMGTPVGLIATVAEGGFWLNHELRAARPLRKAEDRLRETTRKSQSIVDAAQQRTELKTQAEVMRLVDPELSGRGSDDLRLLGDRSRQMAEMIRADAKANKYSFEVKTTWADHERESKLLPRDVAKTRPLQSGKAFEYETSNPERVRELLAEQSGQVVSAEGRQFAVSSKDFRTPESIAQNLAMQADALKMLGFRSDAAKLSNNRSYNYQFGPGR
jgi:hypothetical protein